MSHEFINCPSCGFCYSQYYHFIDCAKKAIFLNEIYAKDSKYKDYDPDKLSLAPANLPPLGVIFDALNIKNLCCRMRLTSRIDFSTEKYS